jgi:hypothetical protein
LAAELGGTTALAGVYASDTLLDRHRSRAAGARRLHLQGRLYAGHRAEQHVKKRLINGASECNVYWQVGSSATLDTSTSFKGTIMALTSIALKTGATLQGRALARNGAVTMDHNTINSSACAAPSSTGGTKAAATAPPTDTFGSTPAADSDRGSATLLMLLAVTAIAFIGSLSLAAHRSSRPRD